jgi:hypothetical protein
MSSGTSSGARKDGPRQEAARRPPGRNSEVPGLPGDPADESAGVLHLAGQQPPAGGAWLLVTVADGNPGCEFTGHILDQAMPSASGGDVVVRLAPDDPAPGRPPPAAWIGAYAIMRGQLVPVAAWPGHDLDSWPERIRVTIAFAMAMLTELREHGADLGPPVNLVQATSRTTAITPLRITFPQGQASTPTRT